MTKEEIIKMALEAGINFRPLDDDYCDMVGLDRGTICRVESIGDEEIKRFATIVAAAEREACAKIADAEISKYPPGAPFNQYQSGIFTAAEHIAEAIRARVNQ